MDLSRRRTGAPSTKKTNKKKHKWYTIVDHFPALPGPTASFYTKSYVPSTMTSPWTRHNFQELLAAQLTGRSSACSFMTFRTYCRGQVWVGVVVGLYGAKIRTPGVCCGPMLAIR